MRKLISLMWVSIVTSGFAFPAVHLPSGSINVDSILTAFLQRYIYLPSPGEICGTFTGAGEGVTFTEHQKIVVGYGDCVMNYRKTGEWRLAGETVIIRWKKKKYTILSIIKWKGKISFLAITRKEELRTLLHDYIYHYRLKTPGEVEALLKELIPSFIVSKTDGK